MKSILALDIGGANIKKAVFDEESRSQESEIIYFPIWKRKKELKKILERIKRKEKPSIVAITMTAEVSDTFEEKGEGVRFILEVCKKVFGNPYYLNYEKELLKKEEIDDLLSIASANWVASIYFLEKRFKEGILIDIGSTTCDIIPFGKEIKHAKSDLERIYKNQLIYLGFLRTPVNAICREVPYKGRMVKIASENFAIAADVYNILLGGKIDYSVETPDGRGKSIKDSERRIARLLCSDVEEIGEKAIYDICRHVAEEQINYTAEKIKSVAGNKKIKNKRAYISGVGEFLAEKACKRAKIEYLKLSRIIKNYKNLPCIGLIELVIDKKLI